MRKKKESLATINNGSLKELDKEIFRIYRPAGIVPSLKSFSRPYYQETFLYSNNIKL